MIPDKSSDDINRILKAVDWDTWVYEPTLAPEPLNFNTPNSDQATQLALGYIALNGTGSPENYTAYLGYYSNLKVIFQDALAANIDKVNQAILERIDNDYNCTGDKNPRVRARWYPTCISLKYEPAYEPAHEWIGSMGRAYYLTPVYKAL